MGLRHVIVGFLLAMVLVAIFTSFAYNMLAASTYSYAQFAELRKNIVLDVNTRIKVTNFTTPSPTSVEIYVKNEGNTKVVIDKTLDVILDYTDDSGAKWSKRLEYEASSDGWSLLEIQNDNIDPGILNPQEVAVLSATLSESLGNGTLTVVVCARYGYPSQLSGRVGT